MDDTRSILAEMAARLEAQEAETSRLRAELAALHDQHHGHHGHDGHVGYDPGVAPVAVEPAVADGCRADDRPTDEVDRRHLLRRAGAGAAVVAGALALAPASPAAASTLTGSGNPGVRGDGLGGDGVQGNTNQAGASGVYGNTSTAGAVGITGRHFGGGTAIEGVVAGVSAASIGVRGVAPVYGLHGQGTQPGDSVGVYGHGGGVGGAFSGGFANVLLFPLNVGPPPSQTTAHAQGMALVDKDGALWFCTASGTPGTWREVAGPASAGSFHLLSSPSRVYDSRPGKPPLGVPKGQLSNGEERSIDCAAAVPVGTTGVVVNLTVTETSPSGWLAAYPGPFWPGTSSINWAAENTTIANGTTVATVSGRTFKLKCSSGSWTHAVVDVIGFYR